MTYKLLYFFQLISLSVDYLFKKSFNEKNFISNFDKNSLVIFDIGSNTGSYIKFISKITNNIRVIYYSFEPLLELIDLQKKINLPQNHKIIYNNYAVGMKNEPINYFKRTIISQSSKFNSQNEDILNDIDKQIQVTQVNLSDYIKKNNIKLIDLLKIDTEGAELEILQSIKDILKTDLIKNIKIEVKNNEDLSKIFNLLNLANYKLIGINNNHYKNKQLDFFDGFFKKITTT